MTYHFLAESFNLSSFLLRAIFRFCNDFVRCAYCDIDDCSYLINSRKNSKLLNDLENRSDVIATILNDLLVDSTE